MTIKLIILIVYPVNVWTGYIPLEVHNQIRGSFQVSVFIFLMASWCPLHFEQYLCVCECVCVCVCMCVNVYLHAYIEKKDYSCIYQLVIVHIFTTNCDFWTNARHVVFKRKLFLCDQSWVITWLWLSLSIVTVMAAIAMIMSVSQCKFFYECAYQQCAPEKTLLYMSPSNKNFVTIKKL